MLQIRDHPLIRQMERYGEAAPPRVFDPARHTTGSAPAPDRTRRSGERPGGEARRAGT